MPDQHKVVVSTSFMRDDRGAVAILFGLMIVVLVGVAGGAVDFSRVMDTKSRLQQAVDSAVLAAAKDPYASDAEVTKIATAYLENNAKALLGSKISKISVSRTTGNAPEVKVSAETNSPTTLLSVLGIRNLPVNVSSSAGFILGETEIYAVIDMSESMGIAADDAARSAMQALTAPYLQGSVDPEGCNFGCHMRQGWEPAGQTVYQMAKTAGIPMREDVLWKAFGAFVDNYMPPSDPAVADNRKRMAVIGFSDDARELLAPSNDTNAIKTAADKYPDNLRHNTLYRTVLPKIRAMVGPQGSGAANNPRKTLLLITDGVHFLHGAANDPDKGPIDPTLCDTFKNDGITVAVIDVKFQDATGESHFDAHIGSKYPHISPALEACASQGFYFQATDSDSVSLAEAFSEASQALQTALALKY